MILIKLKINYFIFNYNKINENIDNKIYNKKFKIFYLFNKFDNLNSKNFNNNYYKIIIIYKKINNKKLKLEKNLKFFY